MARKRTLMPAIFDPFGALRDFRDFFQGGLISDRLFGDFSLPEVDMIDEGDKIRIKADMPGVDKQDIKVKVEKNNVIISAEKEHEEEKKEENYYYKERSSRHYYRSIPLPTEVDSKNTKATFKNGTLEIVLKKKEEPGEEIKVE